VEYKKFDNFLYLKYHIFYSPARSKVKCSIFKMKMLGRKYKQLSMEERSLIQSHLTLAFKAYKMALSLGMSFQQFPNSRQIYGTAKPASTLFRAFII
jgi:hypothetical protein